MSTTVNYILDISLWTTAVRTGSYFLKFLLSDVHCTYGLAEIQLYEMYTLLNMSNIIYIFFAPLNRKKSTNAWAIRAKHVNISTECYGILSH